MKVALLLTGALRSIQKTIIYLQRNVLCTDAHVFACVQNDSQQTNEEWSDWFADQIGSKLISIQWFETNDQWLAIRESLINSMVVSDSVQNYLRTSGSMIEYCQLQMANQKMVQQEFAQQWQYDFVVRVRTDTIFCKPIDFRWLRWTEEDIQNRISKIKEKAPLATDKTIFIFFMTSLLSDDTIENISNFIGQSILLEPLPALTAASLLRYLHDGRYILTFRKNLLYIVRRNLFQLIPAIGSLYGLLTFPGIEPLYRWNAESHFQAACYNAAISIFDYITVLEDNSLYDYAEQRYFDSDFNITNPLLLYCLVRR